MALAGYSATYFLYFNVLWHAPATRVSLIIDLWPLLIILGTNLIPDERLC
jgi:drug/metabolite transporter (DMT)-like permease